MSATVLSVEPDVARVLALARVGVWERDPVRGLVRCDPTMCALYGLPRARGHRGVPLEEMRRVILPTDRGVFDRRDVLASERGGLMLTEYRIAPPGRDPRRILVRGVYEPLQPGWMMPGGQGIAIDVTDAHAGAGWGRGPTLALPEAGADDAAVLDRAVDLALALRGVIRSIPDNPLLEAGCTALLGLLGYRIAAELKAPAGDEEG